MYTTKNFKTKKALKDAIALGEKITFFQPVPFGEAAPKEGKIFLEGPHYPEAHRWYAQAVVKNGLVVNVS